jgi:voltage-gated potassium channel
VFVLSAIVLLFEVETFLNNDNYKTISPFFTAFYLVMITITTVGYGDVFPLTLTGRIVILVTACWGVVLSSIAVNVITNLFSLSKNETAAIDKIEHSREAAAVVTKGW